ncbi:uncharacterized protein zgc:194621 [Sebastes umbrosus]|uniref:uncharacterized protein zgc:194621 n=1 Tax=Sebastes umbrosus TaxID=72105 RepID=UPI00189DDBC8|nr:uncharacterized protein zgc:194621 [Sebastes umbrosus]
MQNTKVIKPKPVEATRRTLQRPEPVQVRPVHSETLRVPAVRKSRASSSTRCPDRCEGRPGASCERMRTRSSSTGPITTRTTRTNKTTKTTTHWTRTNPDCRRTTTSSVKQAAVKPTCPGQGEQQGVTETRQAGQSQSNKAFTVIPPNLKKRREIQRKAEAELAALEELRLSRAMAYVSINPSSVGGCMSLEEVRLKQQQEMMQAKRKPKPV